MRVIMISTDRKMFESNSAVVNRMIGYGKVLGDLQIIVLAGRQEMQKLSDEVTVHSTNSWSRFMSFPDAIRLILKLNRQKRADWISAQDPFETGLVAWIANIFIKTKLQFQLHTDVFSPFFAKSNFLNQCRVVLAKFLLPKANRIRVVSQKIFRSLLGGKLNLSPEKITVLPVFIDPEEFSGREVAINLKEKYPEFDQIVLMASRFEPEKDFITALSAFKQVVSKRSKTGLLIVGEGSEKKKIESLIENLGLKNNVVIEPWAKDLFSYFKTADVYLLTSLFEGYGRTLVEASLVGIPFVSTDVGCAQELINLGIRGRVVSVGDEGAVSTAVSNFLDKSLTNKEQIFLPESVYFLSKEKFLILYQQSFN